MHSFKTVWLAAAVSTSMALSACGGGSSSSPSAAAPSTSTGTSSAKDQQHWLPYYRKTVLSDGSVSTVDSLSLDSMSNPATHSLVAGGNVTLMTNEVDGALDDTANGRRYTSSVMVYPNASGAEEDYGMRYFFYLSNGNLYRLDLTTTKQPTPTNLGSVAGLTQVCSIMNGQTDRSGENGNVVITGTTFTGAGPGDCSSATPNLSTWVAPFSGKPSNIGFYANVLGSYFNGNKVTGYLYEAADNSLNVTNDLTLRGTPVKDENNNIVGAISEAVIGQGDAHHYYVDIINYQGSTTTSTLYSIADNGTAKTIVSVPGLLYNGDNIAIDNAGSVYWTIVTPPASGQTTGLITAYKSTVSGPASTLGQISVSNISDATQFYVVSISVSNTQKLVVTASTGTNFSDRRTYAMNTTSGQVINMPAADGETTTFIGADESLIFKDGPLTDIRAINADNGSVVSQIPGYIYDVQQLSWLNPTNSSAQKAGKLFIDKEQPLAYFSQIGATIPVLNRCSNALTLPVEVYETENYTPVASFTPPNNSCLGGLLGDDGQTNYVMGSAYDVNTKLGQLFAVIPETNAPQVTVLENESPANPTNGSVEQWRGAD